MQKKDTYGPIVASAFAAFTLQRINTWIDGLKLQLPQVIIPSWFTFGFYFVITAIILLWAIIAIRIIYDRRETRLGITPRDTSERIYKGSKMITIVLAGACIIGVLGMVMLTPTVANSQPEILISSPAADSTSGFLVNVSGTWKNVPNDQHLWLVVWPNSVNRYYPQQGPVPLIKTEGANPKGIWSGVTYLGEPAAGANQTYEILPVLADANANNVFSKYLSDGAISGSFPGLTDLPPGALAYNHVTITRTK